MRIEELLLRTMKSDQNPSGNKIEYFMQRAGFIRKAGGALTYTTSGMMLRKRIEDVVTQLLEKESFSRVGFTGPGTLLELEKVFHAYNDAYVGSYKDIPLKLYSKNQISVRKESLASLWRGSDANVMGYSVLGGEEAAAQSMMKKILMELGINVAADQDGYYYPAADGQDEYAEEEATVMGAENEHGKEEVEELKLVETPGIRTIGGLCEFLHVKPSEILKTMLLTDGEQTYAVVLEGHQDVDLGRVTRILGLKEDVVSVLPTSAVEEVTGAEVGFAGPKNLKVDKILVDRGVRKGKAYIAGAGKTDYHYTGVRYGRDFSGDFHSVTRRENPSKGWLLGEVRQHPEKIRVQSMKGGFDYHSLSTGYLNVDRLILAAAEVSMDEIGLNLSEDIACFEAVVALVDPRDERGVASGAELYETLLSRGVRVLFDDRKDRMGSKFSDYDLMGIDKRVIVARDGTFDVKDRYGVITKADRNKLVEIIRS